MLIAQCTIVCSFNLNTVDVDATKSLQTKSEFLAGYGKSNYEEVELS